LVFGGVIVLVSFAYVRFKLDAIWAFWIAYVLTRPLGASIGDLLTQPLNGTGFGLHSTGGLGFDSGTVNLVIFILVIALVTYLTVRENKAIKETN
jgi:uncharacterized membrane-anchored protein